MDAEQVKWLTGLIAQTFANLEGGPGLTCEVQGEAKRWVQVIPEQADEDGQLSGVLLNFAYLHDDEPLERLKRVGMLPPPDTRVESWEAGGFAALWIRTDIPVVALSLFVADIIEKVLEAPPGYELAAWIERGY